jgi:hypothetical protein
MLKCVSGFIEGKIRFLSPTIAEIFILRATSGGEMAGTRFSLSFRQRDLLIACLSSDAVG